LEESSIAIIGFAGRFPKAKNPDEFWRNLRDGVECVSFFSEEELDAATYASGLAAHPGYVRAGAILDQIESFDAAFFDYGAREAEMMDPQHRLFLECAWEALEHAGYDPKTYEGLIGVYGGVGRNDYQLNLYTNPHIMRAASPVQITIGNSSDYLTTRVSYKLNLRGPSVNVQTACSTSLVAVHMACQSLLNGECSMALAGGLSLNIPQKSGYLYEEGGIDSPDGHCRAYDAEARGTVSGSGGGVVMLKRLAEALSDGDYIHAVIRSSAINNDGSLKVGFTAPSVNGQAEVITEALTVAGVDPQTITYVEGHGTGTKLGDPVEVAALTQAFRAFTNRKNFCALGSVKTNIGHLDTGAGVAGLIKTVLAMQHKMLPPSLHFQTPNPEIDFADSPFYVNHSLAPWKTEDTPLRAGVSSFGIGGTNAHVVLEEAPRVEASEESRPSHLLLVLSAKTGSALETATTNLTEYLKQHSDIELADVAFTLQAGRGNFNHRRMLVCRNLQDAVNALESRAPSRVLTLAGQRREPRHVFMFSGQGTQYVNMGLDLYRTQPLFRQQVERCAEILKPHLRCDLLDALYPRAEGAAQAVQQLNRTETTQPALFVIEYALARLLMSWGIRPHCMIGHSIGEYVAACLAGVMSLEDALMLVAARGRLMQQTPEGAMLSVQLPENEVQSYLDEQLSLAAVNAPSRCVVSGPVAALEKLQDQLAAKGVGVHRLKTSHAFHSPVMAPLEGPLTKLVKTIKLGQPKIPYLSNVTGTWMRDSEATDPAYWARHMRQPVRFADGLHELVSDPQWIFIEVGPGNSLSTFARQSKPAGHTILTSLRPPREEESDVAFLLNMVGRLWLAGGRIDWARLNAHHRHRRVPLPTYPFERQRYWIERYMGQPAVIAGGIASERGPESLSGHGPGREQDEAAILQHPRPEIPTPYVAPRNEFEQTLAAIWQEQLGVQPIGVNDNFFELGGDSLLVTQLVSRLRDVFQIELQIQHFFEQQTIAGLAEVIREILTQEVMALTEEQAQQLLQ
jgi:acyl transferase domain-containing protein